MIGPGPAGGDLDEGAVAAAHDLGGGVQQSVTQQLRLSLRKSSVEQDGLGPRQQVSGSQRQLQPDGVDGELTGREPAQPGLFGGANVVLDPGVRAVPGLQKRELPDLSVGCLLYTSPSPRDRS